jgi:hypothetical protein
MSLGIISHAACGKSLNLCVNLLDFCVIFLFHEPERPAENHSKDRTANGELGCPAPPSEVFEAPLDEPPHPSVGNVLAPRWRTASINYMLLQHSGDKILLLPAWPKDWNVSFKLHTPRQTTVEVIYRGGKIEKLEVFPGERRKDITLPVGIDAP